MKDIKSYMPSDPSLLMDAVEAVCKLDDDSNVIGVIVLVEDEDSVHTAILADSSRREMVAGAAKKALESMNSGAPVTRFNKESSRVKH